MKGHRVIVFVNGAFGVGKSTTVRSLAARLPHALVLDPEKVGHMLWVQLPRTCAPRSSNWSPSGLS